ncbi:DNA alkylation repair protein [Patescibacteria group bacterium]|nr:DNA alkylation repair protein [Patescibacteria group bacterium]
MEIQKFLEDFKKFLIENSDKERAKWDKQYLYSDLIHHGITSPIAKEFNRRWKKELATLSKYEMLKLANNLWNKKSFSEKNMALNILNLHVEKLDIKDMPLIEKIMRESRGWALLDSSIIPFMPHLLQKDRRIYSYLKKWINDNDFWVRRSAILSQLLFFRKGVGGDKKLFFEFAERQFDESWINKIYKDKLQNKRAKFFIRKAIGWTLRDMSLKDPQSVFNFLKENRNKMSGLSFREGSRKLSKDLQEKLKK